jgi:PAT family beta-lactamase induction signal transducer AmpG
MNWKLASANFLHPRVMTMLFLGFSAGIPILLIFSSLSLWLREAGVERSVVTYFSWAALGYSFKFVWAPLIDRLPLPLLTALMGRRRAWLLVAQLAIIGAIVWMAMTNPALGEHQLTLMGFAAVLLGFSSATQDIVIDAYRIEAADADNQAVMAATYIAGYRIGMLAAGAGALFLASYWGSDKDAYSYQAWLNTYIAMAGVMALGVVTTLIIPEPNRFKNMCNTLPAGYLAALLVLLFAANELAFVLSDSLNPYYLIYMSIMRLGFIVLVSWLMLNRRISYANQPPTQPLLVKHSLIDHLGFTLLFFAIIYWFMGIFFADLANVISTTTIWNVIIALAIVIIGFHIRELLKEESPDEKAKIEAKQAALTHYSTIDYARFLLLFALAVGSFIGIFILTKEIASELSDSLKEVLGNKHLASFIIELVRLIIAIACTYLIARISIEAGIVKRQMVQETYIAPLTDFFSRYGTSLALLLLLLVGLYRISDIVLGVISNVFYQDLGFTKPEIATVVKSFGLFMTILGGFLGGLLATRFGVIRILFVGALLSALTNLLFMQLATMGHDLPMLYVVISADNLSAGLASAAFIAFLSSLTNIQFTAVQYAIFSSLMTLLPKILGGYSGTMVDALGYQQFFLITAIMGIPVLLLIAYASKRFDLSKL